MIVIQARNVHQALPRALFTLKAYGKESESRNGKVFRFKEPVTTVYTNPLERVMFWPERDANPFFHLAEALWMLAGRNDVAYVASLVSTMASFSDNGVTFNAAYGYRWRHHFGYDQLEEVIQNLKAKPDCRRQVVQIWDGSHDLRFQQSKDLPCNLAVHFRLDEGKLNMTVFNRSNDLVWGAYGANAVHFSVLQEYVAAGIGVPVGRYWQVSDDLHAYEGTYAQVEGLSEQAALEYQTGAAYPQNPYETLGVKPLILPSESRADFDTELRIFLDEGPVMGITNSFLRKVATPMLKAYQAFKKSPAQAAEALEILENSCVDCDWKVAGQEWILRRIEQRRARAEDDGVIYDE